MEKLHMTLGDVIRDTFDVDLQPELTRPDEQFGDYATNIAMQLAGRLRRNPREVADELTAKLREALGDQVADITIAGPGFINITLSDSALAELTAAAPKSKPTDYQGQVVVAEYSDPNPFKVMHAGHLYTSLVGDAIARLMEIAGGEVHRANFGGDVGLHVGKAMWGLLHMYDFAGDEERALKYITDHAENPLKEKMALIALRYREGNEAYETDEAAKTEIVAVNKRVYQLHEQNDHESAFAQIYWTCREWSYDYFKGLYKELQVIPFDKYYPESATTPLGLATVREQLKKGVYEESDGAIVFRGEKYGLHTRVFINSEGLPTYEAKDVGLIMTKWQDYHFDKSVIITGNDIIEYMKVVLKSIEQFQPELAARTTHLTHGMIKLQGGVKMSSRKGNGLLATDVLEAATAANKEAMGEDMPDAVLGAVKYAFLKQRIGADIIYDPKESVSMEGNSGPYLQYAHARARSILAKAEDAPAEMPANFQPGERSLARKISEYPEVIQKAVNELMPHHVCTYLYELAQAFNRFYEHNRVVGDEREATRLKLVGLYADVLQDGLGILGIAAPDRM
jgi:arginyl-tRNA synthetase